MSRQSRVSVTEAGVDTGCSPDDDILRAPDVAVGNVPDETGWVKGVPTLAVESIRTSVRMKLLCKLKFSIF